MRISSDYKERRDYIKLKREEDIYHIGIKDFRD